MGLPSPKLSAILVAVVFALSCFGFTLFVWKSFGGPTPFEAQGYQFHVLFGSEASQLSPNADVRISGVTVGKVIDVKRRGLGADATLQMDTRFAPVPSDTRAIVRFKTLLGETFVELSPGSRDAPKLPENGTLPRSQVEEVQQVDRVLGAFDAPTRAAFKRFLQDTARALDGRGADLNAAFGHAAPATEHLADLLEILDRQRSSLRRLISDSSVVLDAIPTRESDLRSLVAAGNQVFAATASRNRQLRQTIEALPDFLRDTREALNDINSVALEAAPTLRALRPVIPLIRPALDETSRLAPELRRVFDATDPVITAGRTGFPALTRILDAAQPALKVLYATGRQAVPVVQLLEAYKVDVLASLAKVAAAAQYTVPGTGQHVLRLLNPINEELSVTATERLPSNRHNAYTAPGALGNFNAGGLRSFHCRNTSNSQRIAVLGTGAPPCVVQGPYEFRGESREFPRLTEDAP